MLLEPTRRGFGERRADLETNDRRRGEKATVERRLRPELRFAAFTKAFRLLASPNHPNRGQDRHHVNREQNCFLPQLAAPVGALMSLVRRDVRSARWLVVPDLEI